MKRFSYLPLALLIGSLFFLMSLSKPFQAKLRSFAIGSLAPTYEQLSNVRHLFLKTVFLRSFIPFYCLGKCGFFEFEKEL